MLAWLIVLVGPSWLRLPKPRWAILAGAVFLVGSMPFFRQMTAGQMNILNAALILLAGGAILRRHYILVGVALACAFSWKIAPAALILALIPMRRLSALCYAVLVSVVIFWTCVLWLGWDIHIDAFNIIKQMRYGTSTWSEFGNDFYRDPYNQSFNSFWHHAFTENPHTRPWIIFPVDVANGLTWCCSLVMLGLWFIEALNVRNKDVLSVFFWCIRTHAFDTKSYVGPLLRDSSPRITLVIWSATNFQETSQGNPGVNHSRDDQHSMASYLNYQPEWIRHFPDVFSSMANVAFISMADIRLP